MSDKDEAPPDQRMNEPMRMETARKPWAYLDGLTPKPNAPVVDNPSGLYCGACREAHIWHCASPEYCGGMRPMRPALSAFLVPSGAVER